MWEDGMARMVMTGDELPRHLEPRWNYGMIAASIAISLLGAFTSTQLMCQARISLHFSSVLVWTVLGSLTFGFCSIWSLHFVAMLACELDLPIGINVPLTLLSSVLAVLFTFAALASDLLWDRYHRGRKSTSRSLRRKYKSNATAKRSTTTTWEYSSKPLLDSSAQEDEDYGDIAEDSELSPRPDWLHGLSPEADESTLSDTDSQAMSPITPQSTINRDTSHKISPISLNGFSGELPAKTHTLGLRPGMGPISADRGNGRTESTDSMHRASSDRSMSRRSSSFTGSNFGSNGLGSILNVAYRGASPAKNAFITTWEALYHGCTWKHAIKGFLWSLAITSMHYVGIAALRIPNGYFTLDPIFVVLSGLISWAVCHVGCILMSKMETHLAQQFLFAMVATTGVAAMHFTGMQATTFSSTLPPSDERGYPPALAIAIASIAITTCIAANGLLAHAATVSRNKMAEIIWTRRKLWMTIAQKENAEAAAAARSDFIASASHEIRTPLHHLQGYADLMARTELTEEGRMLLCAIQHATKTLSLITNNVLDWSKLEKDAEAACRPIALDIRTVCESILVLLPNKDDENEAEVMVVVAQNVPRTLFLDEIYMHRILMNLLSNALKFTRSGYILLVIEVNNGELIATVKDTGCGVPPSFLPQLFEPFKQAQTRGSQRGTGLGLSIIKQLLHKMQGTIDVESRHPETTGVEDGQTGSSFTIKIPLQLSGTPPQKLSEADELPNVAIFRGKNERYIEGISTAWEKYGFNVIMVTTYSDLSEFRFKYVWAESSFLLQNPTDLNRLLKQDRWTVLVPYDTQETLRQIPGLQSASHFVPLQKPLVWHSFQQRIDLARQSSPKISLGRTVRFASKVNIVSNDQHNQSEEESTSKDLVILLVEDNPINQKLGKKMLTSLGYQVLIAADGEEAITQLVEHDATIDAVLMDQSMPRKDGITATREIRAMEEAGLLSRKRPIIALTAVVSAESQTLFRSAGATDFLAKPLSLFKLEQTLATHLPAR
ncbi:hypothetical protein MMC17_007288 [Xylographa soralifera]|nr:hypothetical protein [Xylographa soralifera]